MWGRNRRSESPANPALEKVARALNAKIRLIQARWVKLMDILFNRLPARAKWICLVLFAGGMLLLCVLLVVDGFTAKGKMHLPESIKTAKGVVRKQLPLGVDSVFSRIKRFRMELDSLGGTAHGRLKRDSFLRARPGLLDSIRRIEKYYEQYKR